MATRYGIKRAMRAVAERKLLDTARRMNTTNPAIYSIPQIWSLVEIAQGGSVIQRIGDKVTGTSLQFNLSVSAYGQSTQDVYIAWRFLIFIWKDDTSPTLTDIFDTAASPMDQDPTMWYLAHDKKVKRKLLLDYSSTAVDELGTTLSSHALWTPYQLKKWSIDLTKYGNLSTINYETGTTTGVNKIYALLATTASAGNKMWDFWSYARYNFVDL